MRVVATGTCEADGGRWVFTNLFTCFKLLSTVASISSFSSVQFNSYSASARTSKLRKGSFDWLMQSFQKRLAGLHLSAPSAVKHRSPSGSTEHTLMCLSGRQPQHCLQAKPGAACTCHIVTLPSPTIRWRASWRKTWTMRKEERKAASLLSTLLSVAVYLCEEWRMSLQVHRIHRSATSRWPC